MKPLSVLEDKIRLCPLCRLSKSRIHAVPGEGPANAGIMIIGQAPGTEEDTSGKPFVGRAGKLLTKLLDSIRLKRSKVFITSVIKCFPPKNRIPHPDEIKACRPYLEEQIWLIKPKYVILLGNFAVQHILGKKLPISKIRGQPIKKDGIIYLPTIHPAAAVRFKKNVAIIKADFKKFGKMLNKLGCGRQDSNLRSH